ncbi:MAG TPA: N-acetylmuramoyl-L-alanine amidase [Bacillota bacterium]|nr:N-acetylmuramoyl-L-alanine amidase [Bacillota bacterium]
MKELMKKAVVILGIICLIAGVVYAAASGEKTATSVPAVAATIINPIRIVHPVEGAQIPPAPSTFVCGSVTVKGKLLINGVEVPVHPDGGFLAMVDLVPGQFAIKAELITGDTTYNVTRNVSVAGLETAPPAVPLTIESVTPRQDQELLPGDWVQVFCKGSPGMKAYFTVKGSRRVFPMTETVAGSYHGVYRIGSKGLPSQATFKVTLVDGKNRKVSRQAQGRVSLFAKALPVMAEVIDPDTILRSGPAIGPDDKAGYEMFPVLGTRLQLTGRIGNEYRVRLNQTKTVWVNANQVKLLPPGTPIALIPVGDISVQNAGKATQIRIPLEHKLPFRVEADSEGKYLDLLLYGAFSNTDRIANTTGSVIRQLSWFQEEEETYRLRVATQANSWWGYDVRYEINGQGANELILELRTPPPFAAGKSALDGLTIAVDAGHGAGNGAIGCTGYAEGDANLAMALNLRDKLLAKGVKVILTRPGAEDVALGQRPKIARQNQADLLLSLHNNSMGYGGNPLEKHGFEIYYYTPMSYGLAQAIHESYGATFRSGSKFVLPDGGLRYGNLAVCRVAQMPAVLIESAYMIVPQEEAYLKNEEFRSACSEAIITGLERYALQMRRK